MSRPLRIVYEGAWYHVMNRGAGRRTIFYSDTYRQLFLALLGEITHDYPGVMDTADVLQIRDASALAPYP